MTQPYKDAVGICKTIIRNGYDAYVINSRLQAVLQAGEEEKDLDIATDMALEELQKHFPQVTESAEQNILGILKEGEATYFFYPIDIIEGAHPEAAVTRITPRMLKKLGDVPMSVACPFLPKAADMYEGFADMTEGVVRLEGLPDETLKRNYLLGVRALRFAANYDLRIEDNTWTAIIRSTQRILDYVSVNDIMNEWRKVSTENMHKFVQLLFDTMLLHGLIPELAALSRLKQIKNDQGEEETVLQHTLDVMKHYPEELPYDWYGVMGCLFHDVGKLFTAEFYEDKWHFHQHHRVGAQVTRKILHRLRMPSQDVDIICNLVRHHMRFQTMLTDKGIRRFIALDDYPRLIEIARADAKARGGNFTDFNHNQKMLERTSTPESMLEPFLNGNEIMEHANLQPGPAVGMVRDALLQAQIEDKVHNVDEAIAFVIQYVKEQDLK